MRIFISVLLFLSAGASAQVYTWINTEGITVYGDKPQANASKAELPELQTISTKTTIKIEKLSPNTELANDTFKGYSLLKIITPKEDEMIVAENAGNAGIQLNLTPSLQNGHEITLFMDGKVVAKGQQLYFELNNIFRGSHLLQAKIKHEGKLLISSPKRRIHVQRPSILNR
ncbi:MAG: hypothetical protein ACJAYK_002451 [Crocinitomicaceae bacterium]|jgi:hypothetical protein